MNHAQSFGGLHRRMLYLPNLRHIEKLSLMMNTVIHYVGCTLSAGLDEPARPVYAESEYCVNSGAARYLQLAFAKSPTYADREL